MEVAVTLLVKRDNFMSRKLGFYALAGRSGAVLSAKDKSFAVGLNLFSADRSDNVLRIL